MFPNNVGFPIGGEGSPEYAVMELHYDNPQEINGMYCCTSYHWSDIKTCAWDGHDGMGMIVVLTAQHIGITFIT